jgi:hypothetical protein
MPNVNLNIPLIRRKTPKAFGSLVTHPSFNEQLSAFIKWSNVTQIEQIDADSQYPTMIFDINKISFTDATIVFNTNTHITDIETFFYLLFRTTYLVLDNIPPFIDSGSLNNICYKYYDLFIFHRGWVDNHLDVLSVYDKILSKTTDYIGLLEKNEEVVDDYFVKETTVYHKLNYNGLTVFSKKRVDSQVEKEENELINILLIYNNVDKSITLKSKLIKFYGYSLTYGLLYEWIDNYTYIGKSPRFSINGVELYDVDVIQLADGSLKYIDFEK